MGEERKICPNTPEVKAMATEGERETNRPPATFWEDPPLRTDNTGDYSTVAGLPMGGEHNIAKVGRRWRRQTRPCECQGELRDDPLYLHSSVVKCAVFDSSLH